MELKENYGRLKAELMGSSKANKHLFKEFFDYEERKLKLKNEIQELDDSCYLTLISHIQRFKNAEKWFKYKPWKDLTEQDIKKVYEDLNDGTIKNARGKRFEDRSSYYNKCFKSKPFEMAGKLELAKKVIEFSKNKKTEVRFFEEEVFRAMVNVAIKPVHKLLMWAAWDLGENINSLLKLTKGNWTRKLNPDTNEPEYLINLQRNILKRSRTARGEITNFKETVEWADIVLKDLKDNDLIFPFGYSQAKKILTRAVKLTGAKCIPNGEKVTWKDYRSSMACYLLNHDWSGEEINCRLGHLPSSRELDKYINHLSLKRHKPKKKLYDSNLTKIQEELEKSKQREKLYNTRLEGLQKDMEELKEAIEFKRLKKKLRK